MSIDLLMCCVDVVCDVQLSCEEIRAMMAGKDEHCELFQETYNKKLSQLKTCVRSGEDQLPSREDIGDWLRQYHWRMDGGHRL